MKGMSGRAQLKYVINSLILPHPLWKAARLHSLIYIFALENNEKRTKMSIDNIGIFLFMTLIPLVFMGLYIYKRDEYKPEPLRALALTFVGGIACGFIASLFVGNGLTDLYTLETSQINMNAALNIFLTIAFGHALLLLALVLLVLSNHFFDEQVDGIVYASFLGLGFICYQNFLFLLKFQGSLFDMEAVRSLFLVPIYFCSSILMGYYVSRLRYRDRRHNKWLIVYDLLLYILVPLTILTVLAALLIYSEVELTVWLNLLIFMGLTVLCFYLMNYCAQRIDSHLARDVRENRVY